MGDRLCVDGLKLKRNEAKASKKFWVLSLSQASKIDPAPPSHESDIQIIPQSQNQQPLRNLQLSLIFCLTQTHTPPCNPSRRPFTCILLYFQNTKNFNLPFLATTWSSKPSPTLTSSMSSPITSPHSQLLLRFLPEDQLNLSRLPLNSDLLDLSDWANHPHRHEHRLLKTGRHLGGVHDRCNYTHGRNHVSLLGRRSIQSLPGFRMHPIA